MKKLTISFILLLFVLFSFSQQDKAIFLHHSTGRNVYSTGGVVAWINSYNETNGTNYSISERWFPNSPWPSDNYPYDYWKLWIDGSCDNSQSGIECLESIASSYELVIFKHCYPGSSIIAPNGNPDITSKIKTIANYKLQYRALRDLLDDLPNTKFMVWTLAPLHRNSTYPEQAERAHEFVEWVKNEWLTEDGKDHPNIYLFDFNGLTAELDPETTHDDFYCLKYDFERSHDGSDSHPNDDANRYVGPIFAEAIVNVLGDDDPPVDLAPDLSTSTISKMCLGSNYELLDIEIVDANHTDATFTYHSGTPANVSNILESTFVSPSETTTYYILGTTSTGKTDELAVEVEVINTPDLSTNTESAICNGNTYDLTSIEIVDANNTNPNYTYHSDTPASNESELASTIVSPTATTPYYILGNNSGCTDELEVTVTVHAVPELSTATEPEIEVGSSYDLTDVIIVDANETEATITYHSASPANAENILESTVVSPEETTTYYALATPNSGCTAEMSVTVIVTETPQPAPDFSTTTEPVICARETYNLAEIEVVDANNTGATLTYHNASPPSEENKLESTEVNPLVSTPYYILGTAEDGQTDELEVTVTVNPVPELSTETKPEIEVGCEYDLTLVEINDANNTTAAYTYHSDSPASAENELETSVVSPEETKNYYILGTTESGCTNELEVTVKVYETDPTKIPHLADDEISIYPNPANDKLYIKSENKSLNINTIEIISTEGKIIKSFENPKNKNEIDIQDLKKGLYVFRITTDNQIIKKSFIKN
jgi:hypothetical protein